MLSGLNKIFRGHDPIENVINLCLHTIGNFKI